MVKKYILAVLIFSVSITSVYSQINPEEKYRRSSLAMILLNSNSSSELIMEINTLKESEELLLDELKKRHAIDIEQLRAEIDSILWKKAVNVDVGSVKKNAIKSWDVYPFPDKYDDHNLMTKRMSLIDNSIEISNKENREIEKIEKTIVHLENSIKKLEEQRAAEINKIAKKNIAAKKYVKELQNIEKKIGENLKTCRLQKDECLEQIADIKVGGTRSTIFTAMKDQKKDTRIIQPKIEKQLSEQRVAHQLVRKWFSTEDGKMFDMSTIQQRGFYDATLLDINIAKSTVRGLSTLADAGEELINNTFVVITDIDFFSNKPIADMLRTSGNAASNAGMIGSIVKMSTDIAAAAVEDGYTVFSKTFLYKLKWDEAIAAQFYDIWGNEEAFEKMNFELEFIGVQYERSAINAGLFSKKENRQMESIIKKLVARNLDENFANLQKKYDVFKPKVPIKSIEPLTAEIGMKEGLTGGEKFEILEMRQDPETGRSKWVRVGTTTVDAKCVWDNRYNADEEPENIATNGNGTPTATIFKSNSSARVGMFLRQIK